jgi:hypothetical protein
LDVALGNKPQADLRRYHAKHRCKVVRRGFAICSKSETLREDGGLYERRRRQFCR